MLSNSLAIYRSPGYFCQLSDAAKFNFFVKKNVYCDGRLSINQMLIIEPNGSDWNRFGSVRMIRIIFRTITTGNSLIAIVTTNIAGLITITNVNQKMSIQIFVEPYSNRLSDNMFAIFYVYILNSFFSYFCVFNSNTYNLLVEIDGGVRYNLTWLFSP